MMSQMSSHSTHGRPPLRPGAGSSASSFLTSPPLLPNTPPVHSVAHSPLQIGEPLLNVRVVTGKMSQKERRRSAKNPSPTLQAQGVSGSYSPGHPTQAWGPFNAASSSTSPSIYSGSSPKSFRQIQQEELFRRESVENQGSRVSLLSPATR